MTQPDRSNTGLSQEGWVMFGEGERDAAWTGQSSMTDTTDLNLTAPDVINPVTGEYVVLRDASDEQIVQFLDEVRDLESRLREAKSHVTREAVRRMDAKVLAGEEKGWTQTVGEYKISAPSPQIPDDIDGEGLYQRLLDFTAKGFITLGTVDLCVKRETVYKPQRAQLKALAKVAPEVAEAVEACSTPSEKPRRVSVSRI